MRRETPTFAELLRAHRAAAGLTQEQLAERARLSTRAISDLERAARRAPRSDTVRRLADAMALSLSACQALEDAARGRASTWAQRSRARRGPLLGRDTESAALRALVLDPQVRLVTIGGSPGAGTTHFVEGVTESLRDAFTAVVFVDLSDMDPDAARHAAVTGLASPADQRRLVILDGVDGNAPVIAEQVGAALAMCPGTVVVATSRLPLALRGEHRFLLPPLAVPRAGQPLTVPSVELFIRHAQRFDPTASLRPDNCGAIAELCRRLDGIPLAIELAAERSRLFSPGVLLARLGRSLDVLTDGPVDAPARHRSMRAAIEASHCLLASSHRVLYRRLGVISGSVALDDIEAVCALPGARLDVLAGMEALVDLGLAERRAQHGEAPRYSMLRGVREHAAEQLAMSGEEPVLRRTHAQRVLESSRHDAGVAVDELLSVLHRAVDDTRLAAATMAAVRRRCNPGADAGHDGHAGAPAAELAELGNVLAERGEVTVPADLFVHALWLAHEVGDELIGAVALSGLNRLHSC